METLTTQGATKGGVRWLLRAEGLALLLICLWAYHSRSDSWAQFALLFLLPDLALLAYWVQPRLGAVCYNITHSSIGALALLFVGFAFQMPSLVPLGLIWLAHIGFDRALGYGLKYRQGFSFTHLGVIGLQRRAQT
jgi:uncharacterized membrane protein